MDIISSLKDTLEATEKYFALRGINLQKTYAPGKWTIRKILVHLADAESVLHERIKRVIAEPKQVIWAFDQDLWSEKLEYETFPLEISKAVFVANRQSIIYLAGQYYSGLGHYTFIHNQTGLRTLKDEFDKVALHNQQHLDQIKLALSL